LKDLAIIILAAGQGKRMKNPDLPKVLVELNGKPLLGHVLDQANVLEPKKIVNVIGHFKEKVIDYVNSLSNNTNSEISYAYQEEQLGTGHAVNMAKESLRDFVGNVLILCGDVPLLQAGTLISFIKEHENSYSKLSVLSAIAPNPFGYGRIIRDAKGEFQKIVEEKDANVHEQKTDEINSGIYIVDAKILFDTLSEVENNNAQNEYYLTDIVKISKNKNMQVNAVKGVIFDELMGVNSQEDLQIAEKYYQENFAN